MNSKWADCFYCGIDRNTFKSTLYLPAKIRDKTSDGKYRIECSVCRTKVQQAWHHYRKPRVSAENTTPISYCYNQTDKLYDSDTVRWLAIQQYLNNRLHQKSGRWNSRDKRNFYDLAFGLEPVVDAKPVVVDQPTVVKPKTLKVRVVKPIPAPRTIVPWRPTPAPRTIVPYRPVPAPRNR